MKSKKNGIPATSPKPRSCEKFLRKTQEKKEILRNPVRNGFLDPKNKFLKTGICNLVQRKMAENDKADADVGETPPPTPTPVQITASSCILLHILSFLRILIEQRRRPSRQDAAVKNVTNSLRLKMGEVLATKGELRQTASRTASQQCVEANGVGAVASNDGKWTNDGIF